MTLSRRSFLRLSAGAAGLIVAAPAIVRASSIMPVAAPKILPHQQAVLDWVAEQARGRIRRLGEVRGHWHVIEPAPRGIDTGRLVEFSDNPPPRPRMHIETGRTTYQEAAAGPLEDPKALEAIKRRTQASRGGAVERPGPHRRGAAQVARAHCAGHRAPRRNALPGPQVMAAVAQAMAADMAAFNRKRVTGYTADPMATRKSQKQLRAAARERQAISRETRREEQGKVRVDGFVSAEAGEARDKIMAAFGTTKIGAIDLALIRAAAELRLK